MPKPAPSVTPAAVPQSLKIGGTPVLAKFPPFDISELSVLLSGNYTITDLLWVAGQLSSLTSGFSSRETDMLKQVQRTPDGFVLRAWQTKPNRSVDEVRTELNTRINELIQLNSPGGVPQFSITMILPILNLIFELIKMFKA